MSLQQATPSHIPQMQIVRNAVTENVLSNPALISDADYVPYITTNGQGWVYSINNTVVGFAIVDMQHHNVWALFVLPQYAQQGIGKQLHQAMLQWYFSQTNHTLWLGTEPGTRAYTFYQTQGWGQVGLHDTTEIKFEMSYGKWLSLQTVNNG